MTDDLSLIKQTFVVTEESYDSEPWDSTPAPGFYRRKSDKAPKGQVSLFDEEPVARTEYE